LALATKTLPVVNSGEVATAITYQYTDIGLLDRVDMSGQVNRTTYYDYDNLRRLRKKDTPEGVLAYTYFTGNGSLESIKAYRRGAVPTPDAEPGTATPDVNLIYAYDNLGRLQTVTDNKLASPNATTYAYDGVGNLDYYTYPNGLKHDYTYDERNRLTRLALTRADETWLRGYDYTLDAVGRRTGVWE
jgi:YD repeat-containing protein